MRRRGCLTGDTGQGSVCLVVTLMVASVWVLVVSGCTSPEAAPASREAYVVPRDQPVLPPRPRDVWPPRAIWVVRQVYDSPAQIADLMEECYRAGLNTVLFQVRGNGTAYYRSSIEPFEYTYRKGAPGFDPLEVACQEAHRRGLALHAWVNVMPGWQGDHPPSDPHQLYNKHPEWFWYDQHGKRQPLRWYSSLNPCLPEVRHYLVRVFEEIVQRYPVDGLHLDYIRFPREECPSGSDYPRDRRTLALYRSATGKMPDQDVTAWTQWRTEQVTQLVRDIRRMTKRVRPGLKLTAACAPVLKRARTVYCQDGLSWLRSDLVDLVFLMNYTADTKLYRARQTTWQRAAGSRPVAPGIAINIPANRSDRANFDQLELARAWGQGFALFSNHALLGVSSQNRRRLAAILPLLKSMQKRRCKQLAASDLWSWSPSVLEGAGAREFACKVN